MRITVLIMVLLFAVIGLTSCRDSDDLDNSKFGSNNESKADRGEIRKLVAKMAAAKTMRDSADDEVTYEESKEALILLGSGIQNVLFEELASNDDWGIRYGIVHVLSAIGTKRMVEPLIAVLDDPEPQVAWMSMQVLQVVCGYYPIPDGPEDMKALGASGLPPIPVGSDDGLSQERLWGEWHAINGYEHKAVWDRWWQQNQQRVNIE